MSFRTFRDKSRSVLPAAVGVGALFAGAVLLQFGFSGESAQPATAELAADRSAEATANRGASRTEVTEAPALVVAPPETVPVVEVSTTVPVTEAPTTTAPATTVAPTSVAPTTTATPRRTTTTTSAPQPQSSLLVEGAVTTVPVEPQVQSVPTAATDVWTRLAKCESGIRNDGGAPYYGYFQFSAQTWRGVGGSGLPNDHSYAVQLEFAKKLQARSGWGQWPVCSKVALSG